jgi:23S rRNA pseudouridine2605 synthase
MAKYTRGEGKAGQKKQWDDKPAENKGRGGRKATPKEAPDKGKPAAQQGSLFGNDPANEPRARKNATPKEYGERKGREEGNGEKRSYNRDDRKPGGQRGDRKFDRKDSGEGYGRKTERGDRKEGFKKREFGDKKPFDRGERKPFNRDDKKPFERGERKSFDKGDRKPFNRDDKKPFERGERKSFDKGERKPFNRDDKKPYERGDKKPFVKRDGFDKKGGSKRGPKKNDDDNQAPRVIDESKSAFKTPHKYKRDVKGEQDFAAAQQETGKRKKRRIVEDEDDDEDGEEKELWPMPLNKYIAHSGECSRRDAAELVKQGKVKVNGELVTNPAQRVTETDFVSLLGKKLTPSKHFVYILLNKPKGFITTTEDPQERQTVMELVANAGVDRLYPVGRLDRNTTGLLVMTNDGALTQKLSHPSYEVKKVYQVTLDKNLTKAHLDKIAAGLELEDGPVQVDEIAQLESKNEVGLEIHSGRNRIVRRIFESLGYEVEKLDRMMYAGLTKKNLPRGKWRFLTSDEIIRLKHFKS